MQTRRMKQRTKSSSRMSRAAMVRVLRMLQKPLSSRKKLMSSKRAKHMITDTHTIQTWTPMVKGMKREMMKM
jgi:hypothetical protein